MSEHQNIKWRTEETIRCGLGIHDLAVTHREEIEPRVGAAHLAFIDRPEIPDKFTSLIPARPHRSRGTTAPPAQPATSPTGPASRASPNGCSRGFGGQSPSHLSSGFVHRAPPVDESAHLARSMAHSDADRARREQSAPRQELGQPDSSRQARPSQAHPRLAVTGHSRLRA